ncbi:MAG: hypothetical protein R2737_17900 [Candidatus Nanopelagicales bacterium]
MTDITACVPVNPDGTIHERLGQAHTVATCRLHDGQLTDWSEHVVNWDYAYGVDGYGVHHPRVIRFMKDHEVDVVVAHDVCDTVADSLRTIGMRVVDDASGDARAAVAALS